LPNEAKPTLRDNATRVQLGFPTTPRLPFKANRATGYTKLQPMASLSR
jgi:hypothetical protein